MAKDDVSALGVRMRRARKNAAMEEKKRAEIAARVTRFFDESERSRSVEKDLREKRENKFRLLTANTSDWQSDIALPDMLADSLRAQDGLMNAALATRPMVTSKALIEEYKDRQDNVDALLDYQFFVECPGETLLAELAENFVNDGEYTVFIPWIEEKKEIRQARTFDPIPADVFPAGYFSVLIQQTFRDATAIQPVKNDGWDFIVETPSQNYRVGFYTIADDRIEMVYTMDAEIFNGPRPIVKQWKDVFYPVRSVNLQPPGPSNPGGADYVVLRDYPGTDEIRRLWKSGYYTLTEDEMNKIEAVSGLPYDTAEDGKDALAGQMAEPGDEHQKVTRLLCFDRYDIDGSGFDEDVIFWVVKETGTLLKAKRLSEMYPVNPPRRPLVRRQYIPVAARATGMSLLEIMEPMHDTTKKLFDQALDNGELTTSPFGFYRASGGMRPETIRLWPGELYPLADPQRDVNFPRMSTDSTGFALNMMTLAGQYQEKATMIGDMAYGRVPAGKSAALRTSGNMAALQMQAEARPERILRRFFSGVAEIYRQMHELNEQFLPKEKAIRVMKADKPDSNPFMTLKGPEDVSGRFDFDFSANVFNTSRQALQEALTSMISMYVSPLAIQAGVTNPDGIYRLFKAYGQAWGQDPSQYLTPPTPKADQPIITAEQAAHSSLSGVAPRGYPGPDPATHLEKLTEIAQSGIFSDPFADPAHLAEAVALLRNWGAQVEEILAQETQQQQLIAAASQMQNGQQQAGRPPESIQAPGGNAPISGNNELIDESLPTAR